MSTSGAQPVDGAARLGAVQAQGSVLVQAPAGSGKTTLLAQRYLRLLSTVDEPERILALTFTRRAAEEMRARVVLALEAAALPQCPATLNPAMWALGVAARRHLQARGIDAERHPSRLRIETIDSFNAWLAAQLPITSGAGGRLTLLEDASAPYQEAARRALSHDQADSFGEAVERVLAVGDQRWNQLVGLVVDMLPTRDRWLPLLAGHLQAAGGIEDLAHVRAQFDEDLALLVRRELRRAHAALGDATIAALGPCLRAAALEPDCKWMELLPWRTDESTLGSGAADLARWRGVAALLLTAGGKLRSSVNKTDGFPPGRAEKKVMLELLGRLDGRPEVLSALRAVQGLPDPRYSDADWARVRDVAQVLVLAAAALDGVFREQGVVDFAAVSMAALRALGSAQAPTDLGLRLDYRLRHLLLDEFQDTSAAQLELVRLLTAGWERGDGRSVFCVGDPMQSIYGFRQAEVRAFLDLADQGVGAVEFEVQRLSCNFRSSPLIVDWINGCFEKILPRADDRERGAIAFRRSDAAAPARPGDEACVSLRGFASAAEEASAAAQLIGALRERHPAWRIAVLVRARVHAREIASALRSRAIGFRAVDIEPLQDRAAVRDVVMLTCALLHLGDRPAWLALLRAPWTGLALSDLLSLARSAPGTLWDALREESALARLSEEGRARCLRLRTVIAAAFRVQTHSGIARWVERAWLGLGGPGCVADPHELDQVGRAFERLRELERQGFPDAAALAQSFADLYVDEGAECGVEIMTIHKAKGLEFDCVIVPALHRHNRVAPGQLLLMHPFSRTGRDGMVMAARPPVGAAPDPLFSFLRSQAREAAQLEAQRLLYVACTRAKQQLHLTAAVGLREDPDGVPGEDAEDSSEPRNEARPWSPHPGSLLAVLWPFERERFIVAAESRATRTPASGADWTGLRGGPLRRLPRDWSPRPLASALEAGWAAALHAPEPKVQREEWVVFDWAGETARRIGSLVHAELQGLDLECSEESAISARAGHFTRWLRLNGVPDEHLADAVERVTATLIAVHRDPRARWILKRGYRDDFREHAVSGLRGGEVVRAVFDRSFIDEAGTRWVIDYKTSRHTGGGREEFLEREVRRYRPQLERYALLAQRLGPEPVRVGLYFPLMGAWREWAPSEKAS
ncbi:MAG TPA: UvrD-helicase domain-containing protein [Steroidobacteraceae bacterium]|nr:UvrD-helicase domain-containing protein [Steroidobacteraceae bacterium]